MKKFFYLTLFMVFFLTACNSPTSSIISGGVDDTDVGIGDELLGTWILESEHLETSAGVIDYPFSGRSLTFKEDNTYIEDYSTEGTDDITAAGITSHCDVLGNLTGSYDVEYIFYADPEPGFIINELHIIPNGEKPTVSCQATGEAVNSNLASIPLGIGPGTDDSYVNYTYELNDGNTVLIITQNNEIAGIKNVYTFVK